MHLGRTALLLSACAFPALAAAQPAPPPADATRLEEVVVTAQKRAENLQNVPLAVTALNSATLQARGITSLGAFLQTPAPSVVIQPFAGSQNLLVIDMRGVTSSDPGQGTAEVGTAVYIDDVYQGRAQGVGVQLADPERIEVLRGPQGTLFGRNAEGGAMRIVTKKPTGNFDGRVNATFGNYGQRHYEAHVDLPKFAGIAVKLDYLKDKHDGYTSNGPRDPKIDRQDAFGMVDTDGYRVSARWRPIDDLTVDYAYDYSISHETYDYEILAQPALAFQPAGPLAPLATFLGTHQLTSIHERVKDSWIPLWDGPFDERINDHTLQMEYQLNDEIKLRSITGYGTNDTAGGNQLGGAFTLSPLGAAGLPIAALVPGLGSTTLGLPSTTRAYAISGVVSWSRVDQSQVSQELQLVGNTGEFQWVAGLYYFHEQVDDARQAFLSIVYTDPAFRNAVGVNPFTVGSARAGLTDQSIESRSYAAFGQATWTPAFAADRLHVTVGLRYTDDRKDFLRSINNGLNVHIVPAPFRAGRLDPAFTVAYYFTPNIHCYARYAQAYRAGGVSVRSPTFRPFGAEVNKAYEIGLKSDLLERRLRLNLAAFQNNVFNRQLTVQLDPTGNPSITDTLNAPGDTVINGFEAEAIAVPMQGLTLSLNYGYLDGHRPASYSTVDPQAELRIQSLPRNTVSIAADYVRPLVNDMEIAFHTDYAHASPTPGTVRVRKDAFAWNIERDSLNGRVSLRNIAAGPTKLQVSLFGRNLMDRAYPVFTAPGSNAVLAPPRTFGVEFEAQF